MIILVVRVRLKRVSLHFFTLSLNFTRRLLLCFSLSLNPHRYDHLLFIIVDGFSLLVRCDKLISHSCFQEASCGELMQLETKFFEKNLDLSLNFLSLLLRVEDFSKNFEKTNNPGVCSVENLKLRLGCLS